MWREWLVVDFTYIVIVDASLFIIVPPTKEWQDGLKKNTWVWHAGK
jgi:hypothetical protein